MSGRVGLGVLSRGGAVRTPHCLNLGSGLNYRLYSTASKIEEMKNDKMDSLLTFKDFKEKYVESWEIFKESVVTKSICGSNVEKISQAYERFCLSEYSQYKHRVYGGNPSLMT